MNLTIQQVSKLTKLSVPTLYAYASRKKLGKRVGNKKFFTQADVQKILRGSKKSPNKRVRSRTQKARKGTRTVKSDLTRAPVSKAVAASSKPTTAAVKSQKPSLWTRLFGSPKKPKKVSLMDAKTTK
jgi:hypothetical protein